MAKTTIRQDSRTVENGLTGANLLGCHPSNNKTFEVHSQPTNLAGEQLPCLNIKKEDHTSGTPYICINLGTDNGESSSSTVVHGGSSSIVGFQSAEPPSEVVRLQAWSQGCYKHSTGQ